MSGGITITQVQPDEMITITQGGTEAASFAGFALAADPTQSWVLVSSGTTSGWVQYVPPAAQAPLLLEEGAGVLLLEDGLGPILMEP